jgi:hypothetical protein
MNRKANEGCTKHLWLLCAGRRYGVFRWGLLASALLLLLVVVVLAAVLLVDSRNTVLVLTVLVVCLIAVGASACFFMQWLNRRALQRRDEGAKEWIHRTLSENEVTRSPASGGGGFQELRVCPSRSNVNSHRYLKLRF